MNTVCPTPPRNAADDLQGGDRPTLRAVRSDRTAAEQRRFSVDVALGGIATWDSVPRGSRLLTVREGKTVVERVGRAHHAYLVVQGAARATRGERRCMLVTPGFWFNQEAVLSDMHQLDQVVAEQDLLVLRVPAVAFRRWVAENPKLRALIEAQHALASVPGSWATESVELSDDDGILRAGVTVRDDREGRFRVAKILGEQAGTFEVLSQRDGTPVRAIDRTIELAADGISRRVHVDADHRIVKLEIEGELDGARSLCKRAAFGRSLRHGRIKRAKAKTCAKSDMLCHCAAVPRRDAERMTPDQLLATGAGSFCGGCVAETRALCGAAPTCATAPVEEVEIEKPKSPVGMPYREWFEKAMRGEWAIPKAVDVRRKLEQTVPHLFASDDWGTARQIAWIVFRLVATGAGILWAMSAGNYAALAICWIIQGLNVYATLGVVHDMAHDVGFSRSSWNRVTGVVLAASYGHRFHSFRWSHLQHHVANQSENDPKGSGPTPVAVSRMGRLVFALISPLPPKLQKLLINVGIVVFVLPLGGVVFATDFEFSPIRPVRTKEDWIDLFAIAVLFGVPAILLGPALAALLLLPPLAIGYAVLSVGFLTHIHEYTVTLDTGENRPEEMEVMTLNINNLTLGRFLDWFVVPLHRYHVEHHLFPSVPFHRLKEVSELAKPYYGELMLPLRAPTFSYLRRGLLSFMTEVREFWIDGRKWTCGPLWHKVDVRGAHKVTHADVPDFDGGKALI